MSDKTIRLFEYQDDKSAKFWEVTTAGATVTVRYGKIGTAGQSQTKELADAAAAAKHVAKLVAEKTGKGYVEAGGVPTALALDSTEVPAPAVEASYTEPTAAAPRQKVATSRKAPPKNPAKDPDASPESLLPLLDQDDATNRLQAKHPNASAELLEKLSHSSDQATRKAVCLNPNADKAVLLRLAPQFPGDFFRNPVFDWLLLEDPDLLFKLGQGVLKNILKRPDCPLSFLQWAANHGSEQEQLAVAMNLNAPADLIEILAAKPGAVADAARGRLQPDTVVPVDLEQAFRDEIDKALAELSYDEYKSARKMGLISLAQWPALNFECRAAMLNLDPAVILHGLLPEAIPAMAAHDVDAIRAAVAGYQATAPDILSRLAQDKSPEVRAALARNPACPVDVMTQLLADGSSDVRKALAGNPNIPQSLFSSLVADKSFDVRRAVIKSAIVTKDQLETIARTHDGWYWLKHDSENIIKSRVEAPETDPQTPAEQLALLALSKKADVRYAVAANPSTPEATLRELAAKANKAIWQALARNPHAPADLYEQAHLECVGAVEEPAKMRSFVRNPDCPPVAKQLAAAKLWKSTLQNCDQLVQREEQRSKLHALKEALEKLGGAALLPAFRQDCIAMFEHPADSRLGHACSQLAVDGVELDSGQVSVFSTSKTRAIRLIVLAHRKASPDFLAKRSKSTDWVERMAIARNPSLPPNVLATLTKDPHALVALQAQATEQVKALDLARQNATLASTDGPINLQPVVQEISDRLRQSCRPWQVAGTRWWDQLSMAQRLGGADPLLLLQSPLTPDLLANAQEAWIRCAAASSPQTSPDLLEVLSQDTDNGVRKAAGQNPRTGLPALERLAHDKDERVRATVAKNPKTPLPLLELLAEDEEQMVRIAVAENPGAPPGLLEKLMNDKDRRFFQYFGESTCIRILEMMARHKDESARAWVASNPHTPLPILEILTTDKDFEVRVELAENPRAPVQFLETLAQGKNTDLRTLSAKNPQTPPLLLETLAKSKNYEIRIAVAGNPQVSQQLLETLSCDKDEFVRAQVAENPRTPLPLLEKLAKDDEWWVRHDLARNPKIPLSLLEILAEDAESIVRDAVVQNRATPWELLRRMSADKSKTVSRYCSSLRNQSDHYMVQFRRMAEDSATAPDQLLALASQGLWSIRAAALNNPSLPESDRVTGLDALRVEMEAALRGADTPRPTDEIDLQDIPVALQAMELMSDPGDKKRIAAAAKSKDLLERVGAILTPGIQPSLLRMLLDDEVETVRQLAASKLRELESVQ